MGVTGECTNRLRSKGPVPLITINTMATIQNRRVMERLENDAFLSPSANETPNQLNNSISPVLISNPRPKIKTAFNLTTGSPNVTLITASSTNKTYITSASLSYDKDATSDLGHSKIIVYIDGEAVNLLALAGLTGNAGSQSVSLSFKDPILIDKGQPVYLGGSITVGNTTKVGTITYYEEEVM